MKKTIILFSLFILITGCTNKFCNMKDFAYSFDTLIVNQVKEGAKNTGQNFATIEEYIVNDLKTSGTRMEQTAVTVYEGAPFKGSGSRLARPFIFLGEQMKEGAKNTWNNLITIAKFLCLCGD